MVLEDAIAQTFRMMGLSVLGQPKKLLSSVLDLCDEQSIEFKVFKGNCNDELCSPFATLVGMPSPQTRDLAIAQQHVEQYLREDCMISDEASRVTSRCFARAVGRALGLPAAELESLFGAQDAANSAAQQKQNTMVVPAVANQTPQSDSVPYVAQTASASIANGQGAPAQVQPIQPAPKKRSALPLVLVGVVAVVGVIAYFLVGPSGVLGTGKPSSSAVAGGQVTSGRQEQTAEAAQIPVPTTRGLTLESARVNIESAGLKVQVAEEESDATPQTVLRSDPEEGSLVQEGDTVTLVVSIAPAVSEPAPAPATSEQPSASQAQPSAPSAASGAATFSSTSLMDDVWDFIPYYDHTPQTVHDWMIRNGFWLEGYSSECAVYLSQYGTQFVFGQYQDDPAVYPGYTKASSNDQSPLLNGMTWSIMRVHFWGEGLDYAIDKCHLSGETWRGAEGQIPTISTSFLLAPWDAPAAAGTSGGYMWEAAYDTDSSFCTVVVRTE